jgi:hypothetical protein
MKTLIKVVLILVALGVVLLLVGTVALRIYLPPEKAKALVLEHLSVQLKREVTLGSASVGILSGLHMTDLKISESPNFSKGVFLSSQEFSLKIALVPLLFRKVIVRQIDLVRPEVSVVRLADGKTFNFSDLTGATTPAPSAPGKEPATSSKESLPFLLLVSRAEIQKGALHFVDRSPAHQGMDIAPFDVILKNVSLTSPFSVQTSLHLKSKGDDIAIALAGQADLLKGVFTFKQSSVDARQTKILISGELNRLKSSEPGVDLHVDVTQLSLADFKGFVALPPTIKMDKPLKGTLTLKGDEKVMEVGAQLSLGSLHVESRGRVQDLSSKVPYIAFHSETNAFPVAEAIAYAPTMVPAGINLKGNTQLSADVSGTSSALQFAVKWVGTDMAISQGDTFSKSAGTRLDLALIGDVPSMEPLRVVVKSTVLHLSTNELTGNATYEVHGTKATVNATAKAVRWSFPDLATVSPLLAPYHPTGTLNFEAHATGSTDALQTTIQTSGDLQMASVKQEFYEGQNLHLQWNLTDVTPDLSRVGGSATLKQGPGKILNVVKLAATSQVGKVFLAPIAIVAGLQQIPPLNQLNLPNLQTITFESLAGNYQFRSGIMDVKNFDLIGQALSINDQGTLGLTGERLMAMKVAMMVPPGTIGGTIGNLLDKDEKGRQLLKFTLNGPMATAKPKLELKDVEKKAVQQVGQEIMKNKDVQDAVNGVLKGIFH